MTEEQLKFLSTGSDTQWERITIRFPKSLAERIRWFAYIEGRTLTEVVVRVLERYRENEAVMVTPGQSPRAKKAMGRT